MKQKFLSLLLAAVLAVTSVDMTVFAVETECEKDVRVQEENSEIDKEIKAAETAEVTEADKGTEAGEGVEPETIVEIGEEPLSEHNHDENTNQVPMELLEESVEGNESQETMEIQEIADIAESHYDDAVEENQFQESETEEEIKSSVEEESGEEIQTEEMIVGSSAELNTAMKNKILSLKSKYPEGKNWDPSGNGWNNRAWECLGFVITLEGQLFKDYPVNTDTGLRKASNGHVEEGWTCYHVTKSNCNSLIVEPGDVIDTMTHTAMVLSVDSGKITCVQANLIPSTYSGPREKCPTYNHVFWTKPFNYDSRKSTLQGIITYEGSRTVRLWKPSEALKKQAAGYSETPAASTLQITGQTPPGNGNINAGAYWTCNGTIKSNYSINEVSGYIFASDNSTVLYSKTINPNASSYSLANGAIDKALLFNKLSAGTYYYKITAKDTSGKTISYNVKFTVTDPAPVPCNFSGQITSPAYDAVTKEPIVNIQASATDTYAINNFIIKLYWNWNGQSKTETAPASISGNTYVCNYNMSLPEQARYRAEVYAVCANGATHRIPGDMVFVYDVTPPVISDILIAVTEDGGFFFDANAIDELTGDIYLEPNPQFKKWIIVTDETGKEKKFECGVGFGFYGYWTDISGLESCGRYTITFYAQDGAGNIGYEIVKDIIMSEVSSAPKRVDLTVGEEKDVDFSVVSLFNFEEKALSASNDILQVTDKGLKASGGGQNRVGSKIYEMKASAKGVKPGNSIIRTDWKAKNNVVSEGQSYSVYAYVVPQAPKITKISNKLEGCDVITYEPVQYAKTYELYRKRIGIDADYIPYEEFSDNKSHSIVVEHTDKNVVYYYRVCAKAEEAIDVRTNEKYYPTSSFSNDMHSVEQSETEESSSVKESSSIEESSASKESSSIEESSVSEESATEEESTSEDASLPEEGDITDGLYISGLQTKTYTGSAIKQDIQVYYNQILLKEGKDYTLSYKNNINAGKALLTIKAKGNLTGSVTKSFEIKPREITDKDVIIEDTVYIHDNKPHKKAPRVIYKGKNLKEKKDFEVSSYGKGNYTSEGTYTATIKGIGNFKGSCSTAKIIIVDKSKDISKATLEKIPVQEYQNGKAIELPDKLIKVTIAKTTLKKDIDYTVSYANNVHAGKATLIIKGKGDYAGTKKVNFTIKRTPTALTSSMITNKNKISTVTIQKNGAMPKPVLKSDNNTLMEGRDYVLSYKNNKKTGTGTAVIKGKGSYTGTFEMSFKIISKELTNSDINIRVSNVPYIGKPNKYQSIPVLTDSDGGVLVKNKDYIIESYKEGKKTLDKNSNPEEGSKITVTIKGMGNYTGTVQASYALEGISFSKAIIKVNPKLYTGKPVTIDAADITSATIKTGKKQIPLKFGKDFEIAAYSNNLTKGTATITFRGIGAYAGEKTIKFKITPTAISGKNG